MTEQQESRFIKLTKRLPAYGVLFVAGGIAINLIGAHIATALHLPLFLDSIGTILIGAIGGYLPGVIVGFLSNLINSLYDPTNAYYAFLSVLLAVCAAYFAEHGYFDRWWKALLTVFPFSLIGGGVGSLLTYLIYGFDIGEGISASLSYRILNSGYMSVFWAQLSSDMIIDLADKLITVIIVYIVMRFLSEYTRDLLHFHGWRQSPLTLDERRKADRNYSSEVSLRSKILMMIVIATFFIAGVTTGISFMLYHRSTISEHTQMGQGVAKLIATVVDGDRIDEYIALGEEAEDYTLIEEELERIRMTSDDILFIYSYKITDDGCVVVFDLDTDGVPGGDPGELVEFDDSFTPYLDDLLAGKTIEPIVSNEKFGWLLTLYEPIKNSQGETTAYACVDISMQEVTLHEISFMTKVLSLFLGFFIMIVTIGLWLAEYNLILPINTMALAANRFAYNNEEEREDSVDGFKMLKIHTGDEIENLYQSFTMTIEETVQYIADIQKQSEVINKMQNGLILVLADMVESRDKCTGDHVRKTAAYCRIILNQLRKDGEFKEELTDEFIEDVVNSAPLHDIGKIKVSDVILNKPGRLTDEEFEEMKKHTLAGNEIIQQAMELVSTDAGYLREAKNLATYHHEKWNGKGYPMGLSGEEIPLSARVMAVADVFDALVSQRSYKKPFTFEEAIKIIEEGSGSHFDPRVATAFLEVQDEAREIAESFTKNMPI
ncbi:MAG: HD domain-containing protein [Solobacterium sp.]|nr:HD domain-containing protein [Solobacterium sp.]